MSRPVTILGISAFYHDSAACIIRDGSIIAAAQEERFTRRKHDASFPINAVRYCLHEAGTDVYGLDYVVFYEKPFTKFERILETYLAYAPKGIRSFVKAIPLWAKQKIWIRDIIGKETGFTGKILFTDHHESHAASAFFPSPFQEAAFLTIDGVGEWATARYGTGKGNALRPMGEINFPHSLGLLYSAFTYYLGFKVNSAEYKVMGLAPYGEPRYYDLLMSEIIDLRDDGSFRLNMKYFDYCTGLEMTNSSFDRLFGGPPREPGSELSQRHMDLASSVQKVTEETVLRMARHVHNITGEQNLCLAGGVALNCVANGRLLREGPFSNIWVQPASGDAGGALGAALLAWHSHLGEKRSVTEGRDSQKCSLLGPEYDNKYIGAYLYRNNIPYRELDDDELLDTVSDLINSQQVIGWVQGRMEFGPRALGNRSILGDARSAKMQETMNLKVKFRESFRPFAPAVLKESAADYFELYRESPYMLLVASVKESVRKALTAEGKKLAGTDKLRVARSTIPAVTHVDYSARV